MIDCTFERDQYNHKQQTAIAIWELHYNEPKYHIRLHVCVIITNIDIEYILK